MANVSARVKLMGNLEAASAELVSGLLAERGRGFASNKEAWAELKEHIEQNERLAKSMKKLHDEMWGAVKDRNEDAFAALAHEFERDAAQLAREWMETRALAKIAVEMTGE